MTPVGLTAAIHRLARALAGRIARMPRWQALVAAGSGWWLCYTLPAAFPLRAATTWPMLAGEERLPFVPWTIIVYVSIIPLVILPFLILSRDLVGRGAVTSFVINLCHLPFFYLLPSHYPRDGFDTGGWAWAYRLLWGIDRPNNCFPSMHVSMAFLVTFALWRQRPAHGMALLVWTLAVCVSTITARQHFVLDLAGGFVIAVLAWRLVVGRLAPDPVVPADDRQATGPPDPAPVSF